MIRAALVLLAVFPSALSQAAARPSPSDRVVFIPGAGSSADHIYFDGIEWSPNFLKTRRYFGTLQDTLEKNGLRTFVCPTQSDQDRRTLGDRAEDCAKEILRQAGSCGAGVRRSLHLVGHSMGGLIARLLAQEPRVKNCIASITSVSTPHRGTPLADFFIDHQKLDQTSIDLYGRLARITRFVPDHRKYLPELRVDRRGYPAATFLAQDIKDNPRVKYFSVSTAIDRANFHPLQLSRMILMRELRKRGLDRGSFKDSNDGIIPEYSMAHGKLIGRLPVDHWSSACLDPITGTQACQQTLDLLLPHLKQLTGK